MAGTLHDEALCGASIRVEVFRRSRRGRRAGFSLVELLVVIAVIALLASILAPSLARAKELARRVHCLGNLHQMGVAGHAYKSACGHYPPETPSIMGVAPPVEAWPSKFLSRAASPELFYCPSAPDWMRWDGRAFPQRYGSTPFSYGLLVWGAADSAYLGWWVRSGRAPGRMDRELPCPSDFYWIGDSNGGMAEDPLGGWDLVVEIHLFDWCNPLELPGARHLGGTNMLFADGHAYWFDRERIFQAETLPVGNPTRRAWRRKINFDHQPHEEYPN